MAKLELGVCSSQEGKFHKEKPKRKSRSSGIWSAITRPNRVFQSQKVAQTTPLLPYFLEHEENLGSEKSLWEPFFLALCRHDSLTASKKCYAFLASKVPCASSQFGHPAYLTASSSTRIQLKELVFLHCSTLNLFASRQKLCC